MLFSVLVGNGLFRLSVGMLVLCMSCSFLLVVSCVMSVVVCWLVVVLGLVGVWMLLLLYDVSRIVSVYVDVIVEYWNSEVFIDFLELFCCICCFILVFEFKN